MIIEIYQRNNEYLVFESGKQPLEMGATHGWKLIHSGADKSMVDDKHMQFEPSKRFSRIMHEIDIGGHCIFTRRVPEPR